MKNQLTPLCLSTNLFSLRATACCSAAAGATWPLPEPQPAARAPDQPGILHPHGRQVAPGLLQQGLPAHQQGVLHLLRLLHRYKRNLGFCNRDYTAHQQGILLLLWLLHRYKWHLGFCKRDYTCTSRGFSTFSGYYTGTRGTYPSTSPPAGGSPPSLAATTPWLLQLITTFL